MQSLSFGQLVSSAGGHPRAAWSPRRLGAALALCCLALPLHARAYEGRSRIHATIGQPLSIQVPLQFTGSHSGSVDVSVEPGPGMPDAEQEVAETVVASYDRSNSQVRLTTPGRVTVPALRLRVSIVGERVSISQDIDVLVDLPDFSRHFERPDPAEQAAESGSVAVNGIKVLEAGRHGPQAPVYGDSAAFDGAAGAAERPTATPPPAAAQPAGPAAPAPERIARKQPHARSVAVAQTPVREAAPQPENRQDGGGAPAAGWIDALKTRLPDPGAQAPSLVMSTRSYHLVWEILAAAVLALAALLAVQVPLRSPRIRGLLSRQAVDRARRSGSEPPPDRDETGELARLRRMLDANPWRSDIRYQCVQRLYKAGDAVSFAELALPLKTVASEDLWRRVRSMADELLPGDARFVREAPDQARGGVKERLLKA